MTVYTNEMSSIKFSRINQNILMNGVKYRAYKVGELPNSFGYIYDDVKESDGTYQWFNYKGLTYIKNTAHPLSFL